jgi:hypothetical protein
MRGRGGTVVPALLSGACGFEPFGGPAGVPGVIADRTLSIDVKVVVGGASLTDDDV